MPFIMRGLQPVLTSCLRHYKWLLFFTTEKTAVFSKRSCCDRLGVYIYGFSSQVISSKDSTRLC